MSLNICTVSCTVCVGVCVCVWCVRKTETRSPHGGIPPLKETPLCSAFAWQQNIMGTAAEAVFISVKAISILRVIQTWKLPRPSVNAHLTGWNKLQFWTFLCISLETEIVFHIVYAWKQVTIDGADPRTKRLTTCWQRRQQSHIHTPT